MEITKTVAFIGLEAYRSNNRRCKNLNSSEVYMMEILNPSIATILPPKITTMNSLVYIPLDLLIFAYANVV